MRWSINQVTVIFIVVFVAMLFTAAVRASDPVEAPRKGYIRPAKEIGYTKPVRRTTLTKGYISTYRSADPTQTGHVNLRTYQYGGTTLTTGYVNGKYIRIKSEEKD